MILRRTLKPAVESLQAMHKRANAHYLAEMTRKADLDEALQTLLIGVSSLEQAERKWEQTHPLTAAILKLGR